MFVHKQYAFLFYRDAACVKYFFYSLGGGGMGPGRIMLCVRGGGVSDAYIWYIYYVNLIQDHFFTRIPPLLDLRKPFRTVIPASNLIV